MVSQKQSRYSRDWRWIYRATECSESDPQEIEKSQIFWAQVTGLCGVDCIVWGPWIKDYTMLRSPLSQKVPLLSWCVEETGTIRISAAASTSIIPERYHLYSDTDIGTRLKNTVTTPFQSWLRFPYWYKLVRIKITPIIRACWSLLYIFWSAIHRQPH